MPITYANVKSMEVSASSTKKMKAAQYPEEGSESANQLCPLDCSHAHCQLLFSFLSVYACCISSTCIINQSLAVADNASPCLKKYFTVMCVVCITVSLWGVGVGHEQKENVSFRKNVYNYEQPLIIVQLLITLHILTGYAILLHFQ